MAIFDKGFDPLKEIQKASKTAGEAATRIAEGASGMASSANLLAASPAVVVAPESLFDVPAATAREALELIFRIDEEFGLKPKEIGGEVVLAIDPSSKKAHKLTQALKAWLAQIDSEKSGEITVEELAEWKAKFGA